MYTGVVGGGGGGGGGGRASLATTRTGRTSESLMAGVGSGMSTGKVVGGRRIAGGTSSVTEEGICAYIRRFAFFLVLPEAPTFFRTHHAERYNIGEPAAQLFFLGGQET